MPLIHADYFTDPLCSWSWGNEPRYRRLREEFGDQIQWHHRMGGLMKDLTEDFPLYQKAAGDLEWIAHHQEEVSQKTRMPIDAGFWRECPPRSTYPAAIAIKAVGLQGAELEDAFLRRVREGLLTEKRRLDTTEALLTLSKEVLGIDPDRMRKAIETGEAEMAFLADWEACRLPLPEARDTTETQGRIRYCFPTVIFRNDAGEYRLLDIDHTYDDHLNALRSLAPSLDRRKSSDPVSFIKKYRHVTTEEVRLTCFLSWSEAESVLEAMASRGQIRKRPVGNFAMWDCP